MTADSSEYEMRGIRELAAKESRATFIFIRAYVLTLMPLGLVVMLSGKISIAVWTAMLFVVAGFTQNALGVLMHEASHGFLSVDRRVNDILANLLVCYPLFNTVTGYRDGHFRHHRYFGTTRDPYFHLYNIGSKKAVLLGLLSDISGVTAVRAFLSRYWADGEERKMDGERLMSLAAVAHVMGFLLVHAAMWGAFYIATGWPLGYLAFWILPLLTIPFLINRIRTIVEHALPVTGNAVTRTVEASVLESILFAPYGYSHHSEHHRYPGIPYHRLRAAHAMRTRALSGCPLDEEWSKGYMSTFAQILRRLSD